MNKRKGVGKQEKLPFYTKYFKSILPIFMHHSYTQEVEFSDKIILPRSVYYDIVRRGLPFPPMFVLRSDRQPSVSVFCAALEFTAEEDFIYIPIRMFAELGFRVINTDTTSKRDIRSGNGISMSTVQVVSGAPLFGIRYNVPVCTYLKLCIPDAVSEDTVRQGLANYTLVKAESKFFILKGIEIVQISVLEVRPEEVSNLSKAQFTIDIVKELPFHDKTVETDLVIREKTPPSDGLPEVYVQKIPQCLAHLLSGRNSNQRSKSHIRKRELDLTEEQLSPKHSVLKINLPDIQKPRNFSDTRNQMVIRRWFKESGSVSPPIKTEIEDAALNHKRFIGHRYSMLPGFVRQRSPRLFFN